MLSTLDSTAASEPACCRTADRPALSLSIEVVKAADITTLLSALLHNQHAAAAAAAAAAGVTVLVQMHAVQTTLKVTN